MARCLSRILLAVWHFQTSVPSRSIGSALQASSKDSCDSAFNQALGSIESYVMIIYEVASIRPAYGQLGNKAFRSMPVTRGEQFTSERLVYRVTVPQRS